jgi:molecular chaperone GrpE
MDRSEILRRFEELLDTAFTPEEPPRGIPAELLGENGAGEARTDQYQMWAALTALTQEVKLQSRAFKQLTETLGREAERRSRTEVLDALLDMRERLLRGLDAVRCREKLQPAWQDRIFRRRWESMRHAGEVIDALEEGYRLSLGSLDALLDRFELRPIECDGQVFDPRRMNAVDVEETDEAEEGTVRSVYRTGYEWNGEVYRPAQVRVARRRQGPAVK